MSQVFGQGEWCSGGSFPRKGNCRCWSDGQMQRKVWKSAQLRQGCTHSCLSRLTCSRHA